MKRAGAPLLLAGGLCLALLAPGSTQLRAAGSQVIGSFPEMSGGFEDEAVGTPLPMQESIQQAQSFTWTVQNTNASHSAIVGAGGRSGPKYAMFGTTSSTDRRRLVSPTALTNSIQNNSPYIVQFYYRTSDSNAPNAGQVGVCPDGTQSYHNYYGVTMNGTGGGWSKATGAVTSGNTSCYFGTGTFRFGGLSGVDIDLDDFVVYAGTDADTIPPDAPGAVTVGSPTTNSLTVTWGAAPGGVDGGGYMIVRNTNDPVTAPNTNGIYAVGNAVGTGPGSGTVAFLGTNTTFTDASLAPGQAYYYRVYTADKAFNYSSAATGSGTTVSSSNSTSVMLPLKLSGNDVIVTFTGMADRSYAIQSAATPNGQWTDRVTNAIASGTNLSQYTNQGVRNQNRFYRTRLMP